MCGVIGLLITDPELEPCLGQLLAPMVSALAERGPDSSGIAVFADRAPSLEGGGPSSTAEPPHATGAMAGYDVRLSFGSDDAVSWPEVCAALGERWSIAPLALDSGALIGAQEADATAVAAHVAERWPSVRLLARDPALLVVKDTGHPETTCRRLELERWSGHLAVAHTRMATESAVTLLHAHPFVPGGDLCVVHNGSFSNYASVRRWLAAQGVHFDSENDSEVAARLLALRLATGDDLAEATRWVMKELDGFFTLVIATGGAMSVVRDAFACKPAVVAETPRYVAVASEYRALAHLPDVERADVFEPRPEEVYTWTRSTATR